MHREARGLALQHCQWRPMPEVLVFNGQQMHAASSRANCSGYAPWATARSFHPVWY